MWNAVTSMTMSKVKINMKFFGSLNETQNPSLESHAVSTMYDSFIPPKVSIMAYLLTKPQKGSNIFGYLFL